MEKFSFKYGTPKPVKFRETMGTNRYDIDLEARMACTVNVTDFDETKYAGQDELTAAIKSKMYGLIERSLEELVPGSVMLRAVRKGQLAKTLEKKLAEEGVNTRVEVFNFVLTQDSQEQFDGLEKLFKEDMLKDLGVDRTDRPSSEFLEKFKPDCVPQTAPDFSMEKYVAKCNEEGRCTFCLTKRLPGAKFCTECGRKFVD
ncbi:MAG: hypothetical protein J6Y21_01330 [Clostridia bacterium]|nr:hypothetical protein [Clostridia bacterium]